MSDEIQKTCKKCGGAEFYKSSRCKNCTRESNRKSYYKNIDKERGRQRIRELDKGKELLRHAQYRLLNLDKEKERHKKYYLQNKEKILTQNKAYNKNNKALVNLLHQKRRAIIAGTGGKITKKEWFDLCFFYNNKCVCCGSVAKLTIDHVVPLSLGGTNTIDNVQPLCQSCNSRKNVKIIDYRF